MSVDGNHNTIQGKRVLITGATSGIGKIAALELARQGAQVILHGRSPEKTFRTRDEIIQVTGNDTTGMLIADLSRKEDVLQMAGTFLSRYPSLDILINNAGGVMNKTRSVNTDGWERTIAVNLLAPFMLTALLYPALQVNPGSRIINTASAAHRTARADLSDFMYEKRYNAMTAYGDAKLYLILLGQELVRRQQKEAGNNPVMNALHPGIVATSFAGDSDSMYHLFFKLFKPFLITPEKGADTILYLATHPEGALSGGHYFSKRKKKKVYIPGNAQELASRVWQLCEQYTGISFL